MAWAAFLGRLEIPHDFQQSQMVLVAPNKYGDKQVFSRATVLGRPLGPLYHGSSQQ